MLGAVSIALSATANAEYQLLDRVVAIVEDDIVLASEVKNQMDVVSRSIAQRGGRPPSQQVLYEQVLERKILESLQLQRADRIGMRVSDQELNEALVNIAANNKMSLAQFRESLELQGDSYIEVREQVRRDMLIRDVQRRSVLRSINISKSEIDNFLNSEQGQSMLEAEVFIEHILLPIALKASDEEKQQAQQRMATLREKALASDSLQALEVEASAAGANISALGWRKLDAVPSLFSDVIKTLEVGDTSEAIRSDSGLHLVRIGAKRGGIEGVITETHTRHILVTPNEIRSNEDARQLANDIASRIQGGEDFAALARKYSEDPGSALSGGDLGWTEPGKLVPEFESTMDNTAIGELSAAFQSDYGWHILEVLDRREKDLSEERSALMARRAIAESKYDDELNNWLQELRDNAFVEIK